MTFWKRVAARVLSKGVERLKDKAVPKEYGRAEVPDHMDVHQDAPYSALRDSLDPGRHRPPWQGPKEKRPKRWQVRTKR